MAALFASIANGEDEIWTCHNTEPSETIVYDAEGALPKGAPERSDSFSGVSFTGRFANYTKADTWYPTWAADGNLYSPWTDGSVGPGMNFIWSGAGEKARSGYATIEGDDPLNLNISNYGIMKASAAPFQGRYPCGSLHYNGVWYYGSYAIDQPDKKLKKKFGWYVMGPFAGFHWSKDNGKTWTPSPRSISAPLFDEPKRESLDLETGTQGPFVKMGAPHFVDFGKNMEHSPDGKAYLVGHGAANDDVDPRVANNSWVTGDAVYMARVTPSIENMNDRSKYEYFAGHDDKGAAIWTKDYEAIKPVFSWNNHAGIVTATYNPGLKKYFMCITDGHIGHTSRKEYTSYILESDKLTGPWDIVAHMPKFGPQAYFLNIPSKFISDDGATMWLCSSANYMAGNEKRNDPEYVRNTTPPGCAYALSLQEFQLNEK
ncbi:DUF4185 domain-containing protein [Pontiella sulfatireligans]|uniref:DUF4185 domain-containing protein n=1 Tax=Pontiella sulfatireligans TaxID=2750658 RepID=A0A6C2UJK4_9BACT|nr:DUF4185 domain-containing protein [Pontiella sulfatireligans]VGO20400.1 hypothetical protein SCARR_02463 [Pontiella sulfatireligans]